MFPDIFLRASMELKSGSNPDRPQPSRDLSNELMLLHKVINKFVYFFQQKYLLYNIKYEKLELITMSLLVVQDYCCRRSSPMKTVQEGKDPHSNFSTRQTRFAETISLSLKHIKIGRSQKYSMKGAKVKQIRLRGCENKISWIQ